MKRSALALLLAVAPAAAEVKAPAGWNHDEGTSVALTRKALDSTVLVGFRPTGLQVTAFAAPGGGSLYVTRTELAVPAADRMTVASAALFGVHETAERQGKAQIEEATQRAESVPDQLEATIRWIDPDAGLREHARTIVVADTGRVIAITGECILPIEATPEVTKACMAALATLDPGLAPARRVPLGIIARPSPAAPPAVAAAPEPTSTAPVASTGPPRKTAQPRLGDPGRNSMTPMTIAPAKRELDRRPLYLGAGIVVLASLFWWNRRRRDRFDREDGAAPATTEPESSSGDDDADDLQAAARGAAPKDES